MRRSRLVRTAAVALIAGVLTPIAAHAEPDPPRPRCEPYWGDPIATTPSDSPVQATVYEIKWRC